MMLKQDFIIAIINCGCSCIYKDCINCNNCIFYVIIFVQITDWRGKKWTRGSKTPAAHPNSRFCTPIQECPVIDPGWEDPAGVPIDVILFGGRRPEGIPLIYQARNWQHGVFIGASMRSEATAAAEYTVCNNSKNNHLTN